MFRFETVLALLIFVAYSLVWITKKHIITLTGWGIPFLYKKTTIISNTVFFFMQKDSPLTGFALYIVPLLALLAFLFVLVRKYRPANFLLLISTVVGLIISLYVYYYLMTTTMLGLSNAGAGVHLLAVTSLVGIVYCWVNIRKAKDEEGAVVESVDSVGGNLV